MDVLEFADVEAWDAWLEKHHDTASEAWLRIRRKDAGLPLITIVDALDGALCHGWIDGLRHSLDDASFLQRYSPRRARTPWSQVNVAKAEALEAAGRMRPRGLAQLAAARAAIVLPLLKARSTEARLRLLERSVERLQVSDPQSP